MIIGNSHKPGSHQSSHNKGSDGVSYWQGKAMIGLESDKDYIKHDIRSSINRDYRLEVSWGWDNGWVADQSAAQTESETRAHNTVTTSNIPDPVLQGLPISPHLLALPSFHISQFILFSSFCIPEFILFRPTWRKNEVLVSHGFSNCGGSNSKFWKQ